MRKAKKTPRFYRRLVRDFCDVSYIGDFFKSIKATGRLRGLQSEYRCYRKKSNQLFRKIISSPRKTKQAIVKYYDILQLMKIYEAKRKLSLMKKALKNATLGIQHS